MAKAIRAEHVGSLLRPRELIEARSRYEAGGIPRSELRELEDRAVLAALDLQREAGMPVLTDGEMRRGTWLALWWETLDGVVELDENPLRLEWQDLDASITQDDLQLEAVAVASKLGRKLALTQIEADFLREHAGDRPFKITMASATMASSLWQPGLSDAAYATPQDLLRDAVALQIEEIESLLDSGVTWIQLDSLRYNTVIDENMRRMVEQFGVDPEQVLTEAVATDNELIEAARRKNPDVTVGVHFCRGNNRSAWIASGSYEAVAEEMLGGVDADRFLLEYDSDRAGGFEPLRFVPPGKPWFWASSRRRCRSSSRRTT
jgi:5-methyltetrahydropteroyltriglutamate--homocysteine methyltransferase